MSRKKLDILLIEDNYGDERLVREALEESNCGATLHVVRDGMDALAYLRKDNGHGKASRPDVIFLDLNIPRKSGLEVLTEIKAAPALKSIPVLMLTTSDSQKERAQCIDMKADDYIRKPVDLNDFLQLIQAKESHWRNHIVQVDERSGESDGNSQVRADQGLNLDRAEDTKAS
jgi:two-component system, chemotaxis family, response regulator Rcp1